MSKKMTGGRVNQKERTKQALLDATRALIAEGQAPSVGKAAARARISEATAYRYFSDLRSLLREAHAEQWPDLNGILAELRALPTFEDRTGRAAEAIARNVLANEQGVRALIASTYLPEPDTKKSNKPSRPAFRELLIKAALEALPKRTNAKVFRNIELALTAVISAETVLSLKDSGISDSEEIIATLSWLARLIAISGTMPKKKAVLR